MMEVSQSVYKNNRSLDNMSGLYQGNINPDMAAYDPDFPPPSQSFEGNVSIFMSLILL